MNLRTLTPAGRRRIALERGVLHSQNREPGLRDVDKQGTVNSEGIRVYYYRSGPVDATTTVVFVHGFTLAAESYYLQVKHLRQHHPEVACLLLDLRGHGQTGAVAAPKCTIDGLAHDVRETIAQQAPEGRLILVGHSLGGLAVLAALRQMLVEDPACHARVAGVTLVSTSIESLSAQGIPQILASPLADRVMEAVEASPDDARQVREAAAKFLAPTLATAVFKRSTDYELVEFHAAMIHETPLTSFVGFFDDLQEHGELDAVPALQGIPGFIITGEKDEVTPLSQAERLWEVWPEAWFQIAAGAGHMLILEAPDIVNQAISRLLEN
ncbi:AB hydrolase superfamily protein YdjP [Corynebacterium occultum]|uniref:AB hydrolase superfamily protein YdjP n=1 Tax=Corynebacterium occultum TaxID=2675219 RepID=A0A6B8VXX4_9CORY|nr:alpha/beta hydrolase [Corynebacterium occultum]QGU07899.1 AB hydrolase superfamily protein YdjP [Corynebacterium occultum]